MEYLFLSFHFQPMYVLKSKVNLLTPLSISCKVDLVVMNSLNFCLFGNILISPSFGFFSGCWFLYVIVLMSSISLPISLAPRCSYVWSPIGQMCQALDSCQQSPTWYPNYTNISINAPHQAKQNQSNPQTRQNFINKLISPSLFKGETGSWAASSWLCCATSERGGTKNEQNIAQNFLLFWVWLFLGWEFGYCGPLTGFKSSHKVVLVCMPLFTWCFHTGAKT